MTGRTERQGARQICIDEIENRVHGRTSIAPQSTSPRVQCAAALATIVYFLSFFIISETTKYKQTDTSNKQPWLYFNENIFLLKYGSQYKLIASKKYCRPVVN